MKQKLITVAVVLVVLGVMTGYNVYLRTPIAPEEDPHAQEDAAQGIEDGKVLAQELDQEAAEQGETVEAVAQGDYEPNYIEGWPEETPDVFKLKFVTSKGDFIMEANKDWAPLGVERLYELARQSFFDEIRFFRVIKTPSPFMAQFGISGDPRVNAYFRSRDIKDEPVKQSNTRGFVSFAQTGAPNSRGTQLFINYRDNSNLDTHGQGFMPIAKVIEGMEVVDSFYSAYGAAPSNAQAQIQTQGNAFLNQNFPELDYIERVELIEPAPAEQPKEQ